MKTFQLIMLGITGVEASIKLLNELLSTARRRAELTPEEEAQIRQKQNEAMSQAHWQIEPDPTNIR